MSLPQVFEKIPKKLKNALLRRNMEKLAGKS
jgi:hypothetical protein